MICSAHSCPFGMKDGEIYGSDTDQIVEVLNLYAA
jgi:hypothetical protein